MESQKARRVHRALCTGMGLFIVILDTRLSASGLAAAQSSSDYDKVSLHSIS